MAIHVAYVQLVNVDSLGNVIRKDQPSTTLGQIAKSNTEHRVVEDAANPSTAGFPTVKTYLEREDAIGYKLQHMDQYIIVTYGP